MEKLLNDEIVKQIQDAFQDLKEPVQVLFFGSEKNCQYCDDTRQLVEEVVEISEKISLDVYDLNENAEIAEEFNVDKAPGIVIAGKNGSEAIDYGIRYAGIPSGHEFSSLIQNMLFISARDAGLSDETMDFLNSLEEPVHLQVFVTPTCPYCPRSVILAHRLAFASDMVQAEMIEATEFPILSNKYNVSGVPDTSINHGASKVVGAVPEDNLIAEIKKVLAA
ncbi:MAG: thioredoxin family protein [Chloroflexota bacterium]|nr:thioredoxin family protein [Chloroflexota bacterium]